MALELRVEHYLHRKSFIRNMLIACIALSMIVASCLTLLLNTTQAAPIDDFVTTWKTDNPGSSNSTSVTISTNTDFIYNYDVDWNGDGVFEDTGNTVGTTHDYGVAGTYTVRIRGTFPVLYLNNQFDAKKIVSVDQWGTGVWASMAGAFSGTSNLTIAATDTPNLSAVTDMSWMFYNAENLSGDVSSWNTSNVADMSRMFQVTNNINLDISNWDTSSVVSMESMFSGASWFNQDISSWNTSNVTTMAFMFSGANTFNRNISNWNTIGVTQMQGMFSGASWFNQDISSWNTSNVTNMSSMFYSNNPGDTTFNQDIGAWDMSAVTDVSWMLYNTPLSIENYDAILQKWSVQTLQQNLALNATGQRYCTSATERQSIIDTYNWTIVGDNSSCALTLDGAFGAYFQDDQPAGTKVGSIAGDNFAPRVINPFALSCSTAGADDSHFAIGGSTDTDLVSAETFDVNNPVDADGDNIYNICVRGTNSQGQTLDTNFTIVINAKKIITGVEFVPDNGKMILVVTGEGFVNNASGDYYEAAYRSLVTLNNTPLPFCSSTTPFSAADLINQGADPAYVSDTPPCYYAFDQAMGPMITSTEARIELAPGFDITAEGTVSVNGSDPFTFNAAAVPAPAPSPGTQTGISSPNSALGAPNTGFLQQLRDTVSESTKSPWLLVVLGVMGTAVLTAVTLVAKRQTLHGRIRS